MDSLDTLMSWLAAGSLVGVLCATLLERIIPILPSYLLLISLGISTARNEESVIAVVVASMLGSAAGCWVYFRAAKLIGLDRAKKWGRGLARISRISQRRMRSMSVGLRRSAPRLSFLSQLVPGVRLIAPGIAGSVGIPLAAFFPSALLGIGVWNLFFIGAGYLATMRNPDTESGAIAIVILMVFLGIEATIAAVWYLQRNWMKRKSHPVTRAPIAVPPGDQVAGK